MKDKSLKKVIYNVRHKYANFNTFVIFVAFLLAAGWVWGSLGVMQRNYLLQKEVDHKKRQLQLAELQKESIELQNRYYKTNEYKELALRESQGLVMPGERVLILPANTQAAKDASKGGGGSQGGSSNAQEPSNLQQWMNFLFGGYSKGINAYKK